MKFDMNNVRIKLGYIGMSIIACSLVFSLFDAEGLIFLGNAWDYAGMLQAWFAASGIGMALLSILILPCQVIWHKVFN